MDIITQINIPRWYGLSWNAENATIVISVHRMLESLLKRSLTPDTPIISTMKEEFGFATFHRDFGFDGALMPAGDDKWIRFSAMLPVIFHLLGESCVVCGGSGKDEFSPDRDCLHCEGTKKEHIFDWLPAYALSASLNVLFCLLEYPEIQTISNLPQLMTVQLATGHGMGASALSGMYSVPLVQWLARKQPPYAIPAMELAMQQAYQWMFGRKGVLRYGDFRASVDSEGGWLNVSCPGDACGLNPDHSGFSGVKGRGYRFLPHNVDNPVQQLTLLAGLAALHDLMYQEP